MIQVWKILHGHDHVDKNKWFSSAYVPGENERQTRMSRIQTFSKTSSITG